MDIRGQFESFVDSPYYSESELCGGAVTVSFFEVPPLASGTLLTTLHPLLKMCCRPFAASFRRIVEVFLPRSSISTVGKAQKSHEATSGLHRLDG
jgi:hypothetical protein